ncbi:MAG TPA: hypothetical protein DEB17_06915 [Chlorobaculum sp.]|uniref:Uncharacterized protein n=1 Tax=Chlorobaculum tepidum (strain ATCC 49652 / DSM 12025 / NBRC 103806 / TLS) TaxID=194439 RepID=Q8KFU1_CHLTE|nr:hypothetical protein CT0231 [Chlorobaculum tepidum TLS]HBU23704.1 hypothetical protein [Chlorobaculum sp.]
MKNDCIIAGRKIPYFRQSRQWAKTAFVFILNETLFSQKADYL